MREIIFRGKSTIAGTWAYGDISFNLKGEPYIRFWARPESVNRTYWVEPVDPDTVGQFTGKPDKNDRKIFEGDILRIVERGETLIGVVVFNADRGEWVVQGTDGSFCNMARRKDAEVIGNIHDNPELLKGGVE